jgi:catechol 2,3-dioxygenase-like lactoylglutathione lyase family enzyme
MRLNHLDLAVPDVASAATFFQAVFGFEEVEIRGRTGAMAVLSSDGFELVLTRIDERRPAVPEDVPHRLPGADGTGRP